MRVKEKSPETVMTIAAVCAALIAVFGSKGSVTALTVVLAAVGVVPWAVRAAGVRLPELGFVLGTVVPAVAIVIVERNPGGMFPLMLTVVSTTRSGNNVLSWCTVTAASAAIIALAAIEGTAHETGMVYFLGGLGVAWMAGQMLSRQDALVHAVRAAHIREAEHAAAAERTRIAREVHDVVAHSLTVTMLHVTGARRVLSTDPARAAEALERAENVGRESLDSIRQVVGLLRNGSNDESAPLPELSDIAPLVEQFRHAGLDVHASLHIDDLDADATTALTAYRVVQEALSNVLQHSPGAAVDLSVACDGAGSVLRIIAENPTAAAAHRHDAVRSGLGLRGMAERVRAAGGSVEAGRTDAQTWRVEAALPLRRLAMLSR